MLIEEQMAYPMHLMLYYEADQYEGASALLTIFGVSTPDSNDYKALMPTDIIDEAALVD